MAWLVFAFSGPILWGVSFHLDKYLVDRYFKRVDVVVFVFFTALVGTLMLPFILSWQPTMTALPRGAILILILSGIASMGAMVFY
jgi:drug/metabolite transporter (DMT)-like permease